MTIFKIVGVLTCTTILSAYFVKTFYMLLMRPVSIIQAKHPEVAVEKVLSGPFEAVLIKMKMAFLGGLIAGFPLILFFIWTFISPGLRKKEYHLLLWICGAGTLSFVIGVVCGYFLVPPILDILLTFGMADAKNLWNISDFISFMFYWLLCSGAVFELPLIIVILTKIGIVDVSLLKKTRPFFFVGAFIIAAIITPPDPFTMIAVGFPLVLLYEIGVFIASIGNRQQPEQ